MRAISGLLLLSLVTLALAGCLGSGSPDTPVDPTSIPPGQPTPRNNTTLNDTLPDPQAIVVKRFNGHASGVGVPGAFLIGNPTVQDNNAPVEVGAAAKGIVVEVVWNGSDALDVSLDPPCSDQGADPVGVTAQCPASVRNSQGHSPAKILVDDMTKYKDNGAGNWTVVVFAQQNPTGIAFTAISSVFYGEVPKDGYTAIKP